MSNNTIKLINNIQYEKFNNLIDICFSCCSYFTFTKNRWPGYASDSRHIAFIEKLEKQYIKMLNVNHWHCNYVPPGYSMEILVYKTEDIAKEIIKCNFDNIYLKLNTENSVNSINPLPEDLCFFIENSMFLGTVSHESICFAYPPSEKVGDALKEVGDWREVDYLEEEHIKLYI